MKNFRIVGCDIELNAGVLPRRENFNLFYSILFYFILYVTYMLLAL